MYKYLREAEEGGMWSRDLTPLLLPLPENTVYHGPAKECFECGDGMRDYLLYVPVSL